MTEFVEPNNDSFKKRFLIFLFLSSLLFISYKFINPFIGEQLEKIFSSKDVGLNLFLGHLLIFSFPHSVFCILAYVLLAKMKIFKMISFPDLKLSIKSGLLFGLAFTIFTIFEWVIFGLPFQFNLNYWSFFGNIFSNFYEETFFRLLLIPLFFYAFKNTSFSIFASSFIFAISHSQYPLFLQVTVFVAGVCLGLSFIHSKNVLGPWIAHQFSDMILDTILKL